MNDDNNKYKYYLHDLGIQLKERALESRKWAENADKNNNQFEVGVSQGYYEVISRMINETIAFGIDLR